MRTHKCDFKKRTGKIIDRTTYCPEKHKQNYTKKLRSKLESRVEKERKSTPSSTSSIKFGSININGLDLEASWAVDQLLSTRGYDVSLN